MKSANENVKQNNHSAGNKIKFIKKLGAYIKEGTLKYEVLPTEKAKELEIQKINEYKNKFGEVPPFNG